MTFSSSIGGIGTKATSSHVKTSSTLIDDVFVI